MTTLRKLNRCPDCGRPFLQFCVPCRLLAMGDTRRKLMEQEGFTDEYLVKKLFAAVDGGSLTALFKAMKLKLFDTMEAPPRDVDPAITQSTLAQMLEELETCENATEIESEPNPKLSLPAPPEE